MVRYGNSVNDYETANKAFYLAEQMSAKTKKLKDDKMYYSAKNKLDLLRVIVWWIFIYKSFQQSLKLFSSYKFQHYNWIYNLKLYRNHDFSNFHKKIILISS